MATRITKREYDDQSIKSLKGADRVRKRPAVIFGSDDIIGCQHSFIEILANSVDEAREGYGDKIIVKKYRDLSIEVEDFGRGVPLGYNEKEKRWNWELVFCELYAGGKYDNNDGNSAYEFSLGLNGLGATATQYSSEYMNVRSYNGKTLSEINFKSGNVKGELSVTDIVAGMKRRGTVIKWRPDLKVFKEIDIPVEFLENTLRRQAFVNAGIHFILELENDKGKFDRSEFYYEKGIADYIENFAKDRGLAYVRDGENNLFVRIEGSKGRENEDAILLQGHTDMVCEKNSDTEHDFEKDPLKLYIDEKGRLRARGTTLGGDNGVAVALMLLVLDGGLESHPPVECLFTTSEEVGLDGAKAFDYSHVKATGMINLDSEAEGIVTVSCAGGIRSDLMMTPEKVAFKGSALEIKLSGLAGGHSGAEINCGRANANKLMGRILMTLLLKMEYNLVFIEGGSKDNAIPRECRAVIAVAPERAEEAKAIINEEGKAIYGELSECDKAMKLAVSETAAQDKMLDSQYTRYAVTIPAVSSNGVLAMSRDIEGLVEYSRNLGVIKTGDDSIEFIFSSRSSVESRIDASCTELDALAGVTGCTTRHYSRYPGWKYEKDSPLRDKYIESAKRVLGKDAVVEAIHAGLECGIIKSNIPYMDIISIGPDMWGIHSPDEALDLDSFARLWFTVEDMLK